MEDDNIQQPRACPKDCRRCGMAQQIYCATSLSFNLYEMMTRAQDRLDAIESKMTAIQGAGRELVSPVAKSMEY